MSHNSLLSARFHKQQGSMLVIALFVIIVLAFLAYAIIGITNNSAKGNVYEVYGARALNAANSGIERTLNGIFGPGNAGNSCPTPALNDELMGPSPELSGCRITVSCNSFVVTQTGYTHFQLESTANCSAGDFSTQRRVVVEARN